jgi:hypothetical protein
MAVDRDVSIVITLAIRDLDGQLWICYFNTCYINVRLIRHYRILNNILRKH